VRGPWVWDRQYCCQQARQTQQQQQCIMLCWVLLAGWYSSLRVGYMLVHAPALWPGHTQLQLMFILYSCPGVGAVVIAAVVICCSPRPLSLLIAVLAAWQCSVRMQQCMAVHHRRVLTGCCQEFLAQCLRCFLSALCLSQQLPACWCCFR
jgi:hypothetical protein